MKHVNIPYETIVSVALWDLPGREEMDLRRSYYKDVDAAIGENNIIVQRGRLAHVAWV